MPTGSPFAIDIDNRLCNTVSFNMIGSKWDTIKDLNDFGVDTKLKIDFQFPPKITSDNRRGTWKEGELRGLEPIAAYATSGPREITLTWTYIVEDRQENGSGWTTQKIATYVRNMRGYFARVRSRGAQRNLVVEFGMWGHTASVVSGGYSGSDYRATCRLKSVNVKHGSSIIVPSYNVVKPSSPSSSSSASNKDLLNNTIPFIAYPLRTDISVDLRLWTNQGTVKEVKDLNDVDPADDAKVSDVAGLRAGEKPNWY